MAASAASGDNYDTGIVYDKRFELHRCDEYHPEKPERHASIVKLLKENGIIERCERVHARPATDEELMTTHHLDKHINVVDRSKQSAGEGSFRFDDDTYASEESAVVARLAAGSLIDLCEQVWEGDLRNGFCVSRPPGHHASAQTVMGFCLYNNAAVAANVLRQRHDAKRILILDWDVHHGNGTSDIFYDNDEVMYCSIHRFGGFFFPRTGDHSHIGKGKGKGYTVNVPVPYEGAGDHEFLESFRRVIIPIALEWKPQLIIISCGLDAAKGDPLGGFNVTPHGYYEMTRMLMAVNSKVVSVLEGGYNLKSISKSALAVFRALLDDEPAKELANQPKEELDDGVTEEQRESFEDMIDAVKRAHRRKWRCMKGDALKSEIDELAEIVGKLSLEAPENSTPSDGKSDESSPTSATNGNDNPPSTPAAASKTTSSSSKLLQTPTPAKTPVNMRVAELRSDLQRLGLSPDGKKAALVSRLADAFSSSPRAKEYVSQGMYDEAKEELMRSEVISAAEGSPPAK